MKAEDGSNYFAPKVKGEDYPLKIDIEKSKKYYNLEKIFSIIYPQNSLSIGKEKSKEERDKNQIIDTSFTYGEVVI